MTSSEELKFSRWGVWVAQSVERLTSAQVLISPFVSLSLASVSVLTAQSLEPASRSVSPFLSAPSPLTLSVSLSKINSKKKKKKIINSQLEEEVVEEKTVVLRICQKVLQGAFGPWPNRSPPLSRKLTFDQDGGFQDKSSGTEGKEEAPGKTQSWHQL